MPANGSPCADSQVSLAGGLNTVSAPDALAPNQVRRSQNLRLTPFGSMLKRGGLQRTSTAELVSGTDPIQNATTWSQSGGTNVIMAVSAGTLFTTTPGSFPRTYTQRGATGALAVTGAPIFAQFIAGGGTDTMYIADGGPLNKYSGTTLATNIAGTPNVSFVWVHNQRLWGVGDTSNPDKLYYSNLNDGDSLGNAGSSGGEIIVRTFGDQDLTALASIGESLAMTHTTGLSRLTGYGQSDILAKPAGITSDIGTTAKRTLIVVDGVAYLVSTRGLYRALEGGVQPVATPQQPDPLTLILPSLTAAQFATIHTVLNRRTREIMIFVPGNGVFLFNTILQAWSGPLTDGYLSPATTCLFETLNSDGYPVIWRGDATGYISECDPANLHKDNVLANGTGGTAYTSALQYRRMYCGDPFTGKTINEVFLLATLNGSAQTSFGYSTSFNYDSITLPPSESASWNGMGTVWNTGTWNAAGQQPYRISGPKSSTYYIDILVNDSGTAQPEFSQVACDGIWKGWLST